MKKLIACVLAVSMCAALLTGCGGSGSNGGSGSGSGGQTAAPKVPEQPAAGSEAADGQSGADKEASGVINFDEDPYEVVIENLTLGADMPDLKLVEEAINEISLPAVNCTVKLMNVHIADHVTKLSLMAAGGEKVDIVTTGRTYSYPTMVADRLLIPLDDLLAERGQGILEKAANVLEGCRVGESIYSVPGILYSYQGSGMIYNKEMADQYGITVPETPTVEDMEKIAAQLKEADPNLYLLSRGTGETDMLFALYHPNIIPFGNNATYGAMDKTASELKIFNLFKTDAYREYLHKNREWYVKGWIPSDSMVSGVNVRDVFTTAQCFCELGTTSPLQLGVLQPAYDFELGMATMTLPEISTTAIQENGWGISTSCERPDKAMDFLNLMYTNEAVVNLLTNGIEGMHYEKVSERIIRYPEGVNAGNVGYSRVFSNFGDMMQTYQFEPVTEEAFDECMELSKNAEKSRILGFSFDPSSVSTQISNVTNALAEYLPALVVGIYEDDVIDDQLDKMNAALDAAGIEDIITEHQRQLDAWLANK